MKAKNNAEGWTSRFYRKLEHLSEPALVSSVCAWSDLLGFSDEFVRSNWRPNRAVWDRIARRLQGAYRDHCLRTTIDPHGELMLTLNDGVVRTKLLAKNAQAPLLLSLWMRASVWAHIDVNARERKLGLPGARTVLAGGTRAYYGFPEARFDDFVFDVTRSGAGLSKVAQMTGNPLIISNPAPLQMNTAFSKAFILDSLGSKAGLKGNGYFVDQSFLDLIVAIADTKSTYLETVRSREGLHFGIANRVVSEGRSLSLGLLLGPQIRIRKRKLFTTVVRKLLRFYPNDENPKDFYFDLISPQ